MVVGWALPVVVIECFRLVANNFCGFLAFREYLTPSEIRKSDDFSSNFVDRQKVNRLTAALWASYAVLLVSC